MSEILTPLLAPIITAEPLNRGLVGEWRFDRDTGLLLPDYSGNNNHLLAVNDPAWEATKLGTGLRLVNASSQYLSGAVPRLPQGAEHFSTVVDFLGVDDVINYMGLTAWGMTGTSDKANGLRFHTTNNTIIHYFWDNDLVFNAPYSLADGEHHQLVVTYDGTNRYIALDGGTSSSNNSPGAMDVTGATLFIGSSVTPGAYANFVFLSVRIYDRSISFVEMAQLYEIVTARGSGLHVSRYWDLLWGIGAPVGDVFVTPAAASAVAGRVNPTVVKGSLVLSPTPASAIGAKVDPTVIKGSLVIEPAVASAIAASVDPTVVEGGVVVTPTPSSAVGAKVDPGVILGSLSISPAAAAAISSSVAPTVVLGSLSVSPDAASAIGGKAEPIVVLGSLILTPSAASALASTQGPAVVHGSIIVTPDAVTVIATGVDPTVFEGDVEITPEAASAIAAGVDPTVLGVGVEITPEAASAIAAALGPIVVQGSIIISPVAVSVVVSSSGPMIYITSLARTTFVRVWNRITDVPEWDRTTDVEGG